jgi:hypothetical protein
MPQTREHHAMKRPRLAHWLLALLVLIVLRTIMPWIAGFS